MLNWPAHRYLFAINLLRFVAVLGQLSTIAVAYSVLQLELDFRSLLVILSCGAMLTVLTFWRLRFRTRFAVSDAEIAIHLALDAVQLSLLLYLSGGATNPFVSFLLVPIAIAASVLSARWIVVITTLAIAGYSMLMQWYVPLPGGAHVHGDGFQWHIWGMWITFVVSALLLAGFIGRASHWARSHHVLLAQVREQKLRDEQLLSIATMAASTAHELGTPLTTIAVLSADLAAEESDPQRQQDWRTIKSQLQRCRDILQRIRAAAEPVEAQPLQQVVQDILAQFSLVKPRAQYQLSVAADIKNLPWTCERTVQQAILNVLHNAADASEHIDVLIRYENQQLCWHVRDRGQGWHADQRAQWGLPLHSNKPFGAGIGLFLTNASIERAGGRVELHEREGGGTEVSIFLPLTS